MINRCIKFIFVIIVLITIQNDVFAEDILFLNLSPSHAYRSITTTFNIEFMSNNNISDVFITLKIDSNNIGTKKLSKMHKDRIEVVTFDHQFDEDSYLGEHYAEIETSFNITMHENISQIFYKTINVIDRTKPSEVYILSYLLPFLILIGFIFKKNLSFSSKKIIEYNPTQIMDFKDDERKTLFSLIITVLPIAISFFALILDKPMLTLAIMPIIMSFIMSYFIAIVVFIKWNNKSTIQANNFIIYSVCFLFLGLIYLLIFIALQILW